MLKIVRESKQSQWLNKLLTFEVAIFCVTPEKAVLNMCHRGWVFTGIYSAFIFAVL